MFFAHNKDRDYPFYPLIVKGNCISSSLKMGNFRKLFHIFSHLRNENVYLYGQPNKLIS